MIRKTIFALAAVATLAATALVPTEAAAKSKYHNFGRWAVGTAIVLGTVAAVSANCYHRWVETRNGDLVRVKYCD
jgi:hypothetical protein